MNREVFIDELRKELSKLPEEEVEAAVEYYEEYFDEAGKDNEDNVIKALGNPKKVAGQIKSEYAVKLLDDDDIPVAKKGFAAAKWIIIGICSAPVSIPLIIVFLCIAIAAIAVFISCVAGIIACLIGAAAASIGCLVIGALATVVAPATACLFIGIGLMGLGVSAVLGYLVAKGTKEVVKASVRAVRKMLEKRKLRREGSADFGKWNYDKEVR